MKPFLSFLKFLVQTDKVSKNKQSGYVNLMICIKRTQYPHIFRRNHTEFVTSHNVESSNNGVLTYLARIGPLCSTIGSFDIE